MGEQSVRLQGNNSTFVWDVASPSMKWQDILKFGAHGPQGFVLATPLGLALLVFLWEFAHSVIFLRNFTNVCWFHQKCYQQHHQGLKLDQEEEYRIKV